MIRRVTAFVLVGVIFSVSATLLDTGTDAADDFSFVEARAAIPYHQGATLTVHQIHVILAARMKQASPDQVTRLAHHLAKLCAHYRFDPAFILSVVQVESSFRSNAVSPAGAIGLMQLMPATASVVVRDMNPPLDAKTLKLIRANQTLRDHVILINPRILKDPLINLTLGTAYLASLRKHYRNLHPYYILAAYNMGPARMDELMSRKAFKPGKTMEYFKAIRRGMAHFRQLGIYRKHHSDLQTGLQADLEKSVGAKLDSGRDISSRSL